MPKKLRGYPHFCLTMSICLGCELQLCITMPKKLEIWIKSFSHCVENFDKWTTTCLAMSKSLWGDYIFCITMIMVKTLRGELQIYLTVSKILRFELEYVLTMLKFLTIEIHICLTMSKSLLVVLLFCITFLKSLKSEIQIWLTVSKILWQERITILSHGVVMFVIWITILCHFARKIENRITSLSHSVDYLRSAVQFCPRRSKSLWCELRFVCQFPKLWGEQWSFCLRASK